MGKEPRKKERYEVLYEDITSMFRTVSEGHGALDQKIEDLLVEVKGMRTELGDVEKAVIEGRQRLDLLISRFEVHERAHSDS